MKKYFPFVTSIGFLIIIVFLWDYIKLPYNNENEIVGKYFYQKYNPLNETIRFILFLILPCLIYLFGYLKFNKNTLSISPSHKNYFLKKIYKYQEDPLKKYFLFFVILITIEFFLVDFEAFTLGGLDIFHDSTFLIPPLNFLNKNELFQGTLYDYGLIGNNIGLILNFFTGYYSAGGITLVKLLLVFGNKFLLILISKKIILHVFLNKNLKKALFIVFTFLIISLPDYYDLNSYFSPRHFLYLTFIFFLGTTLCSSNYLKLKFFLIGNFSVLSILWWYDIGAYTNALIVLLIIFLLIHKEKENLFSLLLGILFGWTLFHLILPSGEYNEFFFQLKFVYSGIHEYILGIEYPKPFSAKSGRWTKALVLLYITGLMLVHLTFSKKFYVDYKTKIFIILTYISSILVFKSALMRSDSYHIKYSSGLYTFTFILITLLFLFQRLPIFSVIKNTFMNLNKTQSNKVMLSLFMTGSIFFLGGLSILTANSSLVKNIHNFINVKNNIKNLVQADDQLHLNKNYLSVINYYKKISKSDQCVQIISDDLSFAYLLKKPTCTQFFSPASVISGYTEDRFIEQLKISSPNFILYESPNNILKNQLNMPKALQYINLKYSFFENYNGYIFYKINAEK
jgi:hypothetical protein